MAIEMIEEFDQGTQIKVIGVGGGGGNAVEHMIRRACRAWSSSAPTPTRRRSTARRRTR